MIPTVFCDKTLKNDQCQNCVYIVFHTHPSLVTLDKNVMKCGKNFNNDIISKHRLGTGNFADRVFVFMRAKHNKVCQIEGIKTIKSNKYRIIHNIY